MQRNVMWRRDGTTRRDNTNNETQHENETTNRTSGHGKRQRRDDATMRGDEDTTRGEQTAKMDSHHFACCGYVELLLT